MTEIKISFSVYMKKYIYYNFREDFHKIYIHNKKKTFIFLNEMTTTKNNFENFFILIKNELKKKFNIKLIIFFYWTEILKFFFKCTMFNVVSKLLNEGFKVQINKIVLFKF